ncbi:hypothetical protein BP6252_08337 [Coleophoma cylindrospora]|uniref:Uncharacterized protein n=1 Tax=Coleophoma cylindrospora TaxID=1849047 RepID=A0A3D8R5P2_9HELO|nr:hypothetical protein BP6252_08337 [Coleophoma cylindrospora]
MWGAAVAVSILLAGQVSAGAINHGGVLVRKDEGSMEGVMKRYVDAVVEPAGEKKMVKRAMNVSEWDTETQAACTSALALMNGTSNPSGMAACYNIPSLDSTTGVFEADLRLYMLQAPNGDFANIPTDSVMVGLNYAGATVSAVNMAQLQRRGDTSLISWPRDEQGNLKRAVEPVQSQVYTFVGQINKAQLTTGMSNSTLEQLVTPTVTLTGTTNGKAVNTTLSSSEASFVYGVFSRAVSDGTTFSKSQAAIAPIQTLITAPNAPFVLPGTAILIAPVGGIITAVWTVLFCGAIGYGTFGRMQFADQFRRRSAIAAKGNQSRI